MIQFKDLTVKTKLSETQFYSIKTVDPVNEVIEVTNDLGQNITLTKAYVEKLLVSSDHIKETRKMSRTDVINLFLTSTNVVCKVNYNKKVDEKEVQSKILALYPNKGGKIMSQADFEKAINQHVKDLLIGEERTMVGRHYGKLDEYGRLSFIDMEEKGGYDEAKDYDTRTRKVDPRTINWLILRGVKYEVK